jgi:hypothetical protein
LAYSAPQFFWVDTFPRYMADEIEQESINDRKLATVETVFEATRDAVKWVSGCFRTNVGENGVKLSFNIPTCHSLMTALLKLA